MTVTPGVSTVISLHAVELPLYPPQPANEITGLTTVLEKVIVRVPRGVHNALCGQFTLLVCNKTPGSVTNPVATKSPAAPPRWLSDSVASLIQR